MVSESFSQKAGHRIRRPNFVGMAGKKKKKKKKKDTAGKGNDERTSVLSEPDLVKGFTSQ